jgi:hypothetical protein
MRAADLAAHCRVFRLSFWFWEVLPFWICGVALLVVARINPDYLGQATNVRHLHRAGYLIVAMGGVGCLLLIEASFLLSHARRLWFGAAGKVGRPSTGAWIGTPVFVFLAALVTLAGLFVVLVTPAAVVLISQSHHYSGGQ